MRVVRFLALAALSLPVSLSAQMGLAARGSTLGVGGELLMRAGRGFGFRLGGNYFQLSRDLTIQDNHYTVTPHFENGTAIVDLFPFGGPFHLSGGVILNYNEGRLVGHPPFSIGGQSYTGDEVTEFTGMVSFKRSAPYVGLGLAGRGRFALLLDLGVGFTGTPIVTLSGETTLQGSAKTDLETRLLAEQQKVQDEIDSHVWLRYHPVVSLGLKLGF